MKQILQLTPTDLTLLFRDFAETNAKYMTTDKKYLIIITILLAIIALSVIILIIKLIDNNKKLVRHMSEKDYSILPNMTHNATNNFSQF